MSCAFLLRNQEAYRTVTKLTALMTSATMVRISMASGIWFQTKRLWLRQPKPTLFSVRCFPWA